MKKASLYDRRVVITDNYEEEKEVFFNTTKHTIKMQNCS